MTADLLGQPYTLAQLLPEQALGAAASLALSGLCLDSRKLAAGEVFIALPGTKVDGRQFIDQAIAAGASAVLVDADTPQVEWRDSVPVVGLPQLSAQVSSLAARFYHDPSAEMRVTGVTGTNGKTSCSLLLGQLCAHLRGKAMVLGTLGNGLLVADNNLAMSQQIAQFESTGLTTADPIAVQRALAEARDKGVHSLAMEVSSHSLVQGRVAAVHFDCAIFTNLTQDHLDYHGDMESYGQAKERLLHMPGLRCALINADDPWSRKLPAKAPVGVSCYTYSLLDPAASIHARDYEFTAEGISAWVVTPWGEGQLRSRLLGVFNLSNLLAVIGAACLRGAPLADVLEKLPLLEPAPGRMQAVVLEQSKQDIGVVVDYAHTPDALEKCLSALRGHTSGRLWVIFGCGGDRDKTKRPLMGRIAERMADYVIVTNDNPRSEEPAVIAADILRGMYNSHGCLVIADRAQAIDLAVQQARAGDLVVIAGKGHEDYQIFASQTLPFSDIKQARLSLQRRLARNASEGRS